MRNRFTTILLVLILNGCINQQLTPTEFTRLARDHAMQTPDIEVEIVDELALAYTDSAGIRYTSYLDNAYRDYKLTPDSLDQILDTYVKGQTLLTMHRVCQLTDLSQIVQVVVGRTAIDGWKNVADDIEGDPVTKPINEELFLCLAIDAPTHYVYLNQAMIDKTGLTFEQLCDTAWENVKQEATVEAYTAGDVFKFSLNGMSESTALLLDTLWDNRALLDQAPDGYFANFKGDVIMAYPARNHLMATTTGNAAGMALLREELRSAEEKYGHFISDKLFIRRNGKWEVFE